MPLGPGKISREALVTLACTHNPSLFFIADIRDALLVSAFSDSCAQARELTRWDGSNGHSHSTVLIHTRFDPDTTILSEPSCCPAVPTS